MAFSAKKRDAQIRNWRIFRLRGAWHELHNLGVVNALPAIDVKLAELGAEPETARRKRLHDKWLEELEAELAQP